MVGILQAILCVITALGSIIQAAGVLIVQIVVNDLAALLLLIAALLPSMPSFPSLASLDMAWLPYFIPVASLVSLLGIGVTLFATMFGLRIGLRWIKAL